MSSKTSGLRVMADYAGRIEIDWRGYVTLIDHHNRPAFDDLVPSGTYYAKLAVLAINGGDYLDLASTEAFCLLREHLHLEDEAAKRWLLTPAHFIGGRLPAELLHTRAGRQKIKASILGIAHGNFL